MLDCEFTVIEGPYARRKFWQMFTVSGGKVDEKGDSKGWNISKSTFRAMIDSALGLDPKDKSAAAKAEAHPPGLAELDGIVFVARIMVEPSERSPLRRPEPARSRGAADRAGMKLVMHGEDVPAEPEPLARSRRKAAAAQPAWTQTRRRPIAAASQPRPPQSCRATAWSQAARPPALRQPSRPARPGSTAERA